MEATVVLSDLRGSRKKADRPELGGMIAEGLERLSARFSRHLVAPFEPQRGIDEFGAILSTDAPAGEILLELFKHLHPHEARFALVRGQLDVVPPPGKRSIHRFDGPAFHAATAALEDIDQQGRLVTVCREDRPVDATRTTLVNLVYFQLLDWTPHQMEIYEAYEELGMQAEVAERFDITQPTVSRTLQAIRARFMQQATKTMCRNVDLALEA